MGKVGRGGGVGRGEKEGEDEVRGDCRFGIFSCCSNSSGPILGSNWERISMAFKLDRVDIYQINSFSNEGKGKENNGGRLDKK